MIEIEEAIKRLTEIWRYEHTDKYTDEEIREAIDLAIDNLKMKQWMIDRYEHEVDLLERDLEDKSLNRMVIGAKLVVYRQVLNDLTAEDCEE